VVIDQSASSADLSPAFDGDSPIDVSTGSGDDAVKEPQAKTPRCRRRNDHVAGGSGDDSLTCGPGADAFLFDANLSKQNVANTLDDESNFDHVTDFAPGEDHIEIDQTIFNTLEVSGLKKKQFFKRNDIEDAGKTVLIVHDKGSDELAYVACKGDFVFVILDNSPNELGHKDFDIVA